MKPDRDSIEYDYKVENLKELHTLDDQGHIDLFYGDEAGFSLNCVIPYAWQFPGQQICMVAQHSKRINVLGFMNRDGNRLHTFSKEGTIKSTFVIDSIDTFVSCLQKPTVLILDNAPIHHAKLFQDKIAEWEAKNLSIFFLPAYCPHLNRIELLWRQVKYYWLQPQDYQDLGLLQTALDKIWSSFGEKFTIKFKEKASI